MGCPRLFDWKKCRWYPWVKLSVSPMFSITVLQIIALCLPFVLLCKNGNSVEYFNVVFTIRMVTTWFSTWLKCVVLRCVPYLSFLRLLSIPRIAFWRALDSPLIAVKMDKFKWERRANNLHAPNQIPWCNTLHHHNSPLPSHHALHKWCELSDSCKKLCPDSNRPPFKSAASAPQHYSARGNLYPQYLSYSPGSSNQTQPDIQK